MAIDTQAKRNSALLEIQGILIPDGAIDQSDRGTLLGFYSGIAPVSSSASPTYGREAAAGGSTGAGGVFPPLGAGQSFLIQDWKRCSDRLNRRILVHAAATGTFNLNLQTTGDDRVTTYNAPQVASSTVAVDGGLTGFTESAELNEKVDYLYRVVLTNTSGGQIDYAYELREYSSWP